MYLRGKCGCFDRGGFTGAKAVATVATTSGIVAAASQVGSNFRAAGQQVVQAVSSVFRGGESQPTASTSTAAPGSATAASGTTSTALSTNLAYPANNGFAGTPSRVTSYVGEVWQRIGETGGQYLTTPGTHPSQKSLDFSNWGNKVHFYQTVQEFEYLGGYAALYYGLPGGGYQAYIEQRVF